MLLNKADFFTLSLFLCNLDFSTGGLTLACNSAGYEVTALSCHRPTGGHFPVLMMSLK